MSRTIILGSWRIRPLGIRHADHVATSPQKLALTSPISGGRSVGIVRSRTLAKEYTIIFVLI
jgi:hypothetical protein